jgi:hypothetical protein
LRPVRNGFEARALFTPERAPIPDNVKLPPSTVGVGGSLLYPPPRIMHSTPGSVS